jgi:hypothetical protein
MANLRGDKLRGLTRITATSLLHRGLCQKRILRYSNPLAELAFQIIDFYIDGNSDLPSPAQLLSRLEAQSSLENIRCERRSKLLGYRPFLDR